VRIGIIFAKKSGGWVEICNKKTYGGGIDIWVVYVIIPYNKVVCTLHQCPDISFMATLSCLYVQKCHLHSISLVGGAFTAHKRSIESENTGYSFVGCRLTGLGTGTSVLGRPWGAYSRVIFALSYMSNTVRPEGWDDWGNPTKRRYSTN
jgi:hypothetical protein